MEQTVTCPNCGYTFRIAKETFEKYREGVSLKKQHEVTDGEAILLDCVKCARVLRISIRTWNLVGDGPAAHERSYEWTGDGAARPALTGERPAGTVEPVVPAGPAGPTALIRLAEYGRIEKALPDRGIGAALGALFLALLPAAALLFEPLVAARAALPDYTVPVPERRAVELPAAAEPEKSEEPAPAAEEPRLLTPVKEPTFVSGKFKKILKDHTGQIEEIDKPAAAPQGK